jgi:hypothetical protein
MLPPHDAPSPDDPLARLFRGSRPDHRVDLAEGVRARLARGEGREEASDPLEEWLEARLAASPDEPSADFIPRTLLRLQHPAGRTSGLWRVGGSLAAGLAACLALAILPGEPAGAARPSGQPTSEVARLPLPRGISATVAELPAEPSIDPEIARILALAQGLDQPARWLLRDPKLVTFAAALE